MKYFSINQLNDKKHFSSSKGSWVYIFLNIKEYEDEIHDIIEEGKLGFSEIKSLVESWGGQMDLIPLDELIKNYLKKEKDDMEKFKK